jgi:uncharacterized protein YndB with AHSA1/START domain
MEMTKKQIRVESLIEAPAAEVWKAITDKELVSEWLMETNIEPRKGFRAYFKMKPMPGFDGNIVCEVKDVQENKLFEYTWQSNWMKEPTTIRFTLEPAPKGTLLVLEHWGFKGFSGFFLKKMMSGGWKTMLSKRIPQLIKQKK